MTSRSRLRAPGHERELNLVVGDGRVIDVSRLFESWVLPRDRHRAPADEVVLRFDAFDRAHVWPRDASA